MRKAKRVASEKVSGRKSQNVLSATRAPRRRAVRKTYRIEALVSGASPERLTEGAFFRLAVLGKRPTSAQIQQVVAKGGTAIAGAIAELVYDKAARLKGAPAEKILKVLLSL